MSLLNRIKRRIKIELYSKFIFRIHNLYITLFSKQYIIINASVSPVCYNWGDNASEWLVKFINPALIPIHSHYTWNVFCKEDYMCIGSILSWRTTKRSIVWGTGLVYPNDKISSKPRKVIAVRGPLTRNYLLEQGIECPEVYGDPAMLFPLFYRPPFKKKYKIGIIPHFRDKTNEVFRELSNNDDVLVIDVEIIRPWHKFIDDICSCEFIFSSSLHGVIISDAYRVPNVWVEFEGGEKKRFAFIDYYQSVCNTVEAPIILNQCSNLITIRDNFNWSQPKINIQDLLNCCPFKK